MITVRRRRACLCRPESTVRWAAKLGGLELLRWGGRRWHKKDGQDNHQRPVHLPFTFSSLSLLNMTVPTELFRQ